MKEDDYVSVSNLTKARIAESIIRNLFPVLPVTKSDQEKILVILETWITNLENLTYG